ncbi:hypothetical protein [Massilia sp. PWRC2]|uniref:hypothetical protein n=1 Tax=Massilia sp. PWRC2 TaxID=2804626 RepID=UPI003CE8DF5C
MLESKLLSDFNNGEPAYWAGENVPSAGFEHSTDLFDAGADFRLSPSEHGRYHRVYLVENDLGHYKQWPLIMDEALRLFQYGQQGTLFVRFSETPLLSAFAFAAFLRRRKDFAFELVYQDSFPGGVLFYCLRCQRENIEPALSSIEFALITDGRRPEAVARFVASIAAIRGIDLIDWSIAICGPALAEEGAVAVKPRIRHIDAPTAHLNRGWITAKKNLIVSTSQADNLVIAHDRYKVPAAFLEELFEFGADFSVLVPAQFDDSGDIFPDWVTIGSQWSCTGSALLQHGDYSPHGYVNGGVIIGKRHVLSATPWSELLFWGQYEDVELSRALVADGVTPRLARSVQLHATTSRPGYLGDFERLPYLPSNFPLPRFAANQTDVVVGEFPFGDTVKFNVTTTPRTLCAVGIVATNSEWTCVPDGLVLLQRRAHLAIGLPFHAHRRLFLTIYIPAYSGAMLMTIDANGTRLQLRWKECDNGLRCATASLDSTMTGQERNVVLSFTSDMDGVLLSALGISAQDGGGSKTPLAYARVNGMTAGIFREGWGDPEPWGIWTVAAQAHLELPLTGLAAGRDLEVSITATSYGRVAGAIQLIGIACNGLPLTCVAIAALTAPAQFVIRIPVAMIRELPIIKLTFVPATASRPDAAGGIVDGRLLGFGLIALEVRAA